MRIRICQCYIVSQEKEQRRKRKKLNFYLYFSIRNLIIQFYHDHYSLTAIQLDFSDMTVNKIYDIKHRCEQIYDIKHIYMRIKLNNL